MKTNKTPIQEALRICKDSVPLIQNDTSRQYINDIYRNISLLLEKEKQFAFDCFEAGIGCLVKNTHSVTFTDPIDFKKEFESFYAKQHTK